MLALLSSPLRRWLLATLLLPVIAFALSKLGLYLQRRNGGAPTRVSRALLSISTFTGRLSSGRREDPDPKQPHRRQQPPSRPLAFERESALTQSQQKDSLCAL
jgi:hypothetical protein